MDASSRTRKWRSKKKEEGGKAVHVLLEKESAERLERLRSEHFKGYSNPQIFSLALEALEQHHITSNEVATDSNLDSIRNVLDVHEQRIKAIEKELDRIKSSSKKVDSSQVATSEEISYSNDERNIVMTKIEQLKEKKLSHQAIADQLNAERIPTFSGRGQWHAKSISRVLAVGEGKGEFQQ